MDGPDGPIAPSGRGRPFCRFIQHEAYNIQMNISTLYIYIEASKRHISIIVHDLCSFTPVEYICWNGAKYQNNILEIHMYV